MATGGAGGARRIPQRQKWPRHRRGRCVASNRPKRFLTKREHSVMSIYNWQILHLKSNPIQRSLCCLCKCCEWCVCVSECIKRRAMPRGGGTYLWPGQAAGEGRFYSWSCLSNWDQVSFSAFRFWLHLNSRRHVLSKTSKEVLYFEEKLTITYFTFLT